MGQIYILGLKRKCSSRHKLFKIIHAFTPKKKDDNKKPDVFSCIINEYKAAVFLALGSEIISKNKTQFAGP
jgi:hypothetical protein